MLEKRSGCRHYNIKPDFPLSENKNLAFFMNTK